MSYINLSQGAVVLAMPPAAMCSAGNGEATSYTMASNIGSNRIVNNS
ncbi:TPA: hypothetical protein ACXM5A_000661 [Stenotrophomonas maltophilia]